MLKVQDYEQTKSFQVQFRSVQVQSKALQVYTRSFQIQSRSLSLCQSRSLLVPLEQAIPNTELVTYYWASNSRCWSQSLYQNEQVTWGTYVTQGTTCAEQVTAVNVTFCLTFWLLVLTFWITLRRLRSLPCTLSLNAGMDNQADISFWNTQVTG